MRRWFLSYNSQDLGHMQALEGSLRRKDPDARLFFAEKSLRAGGHWLPELAKEIAEATAFVLLVGERGIGPWQVLEYYEALDKRAKSPDFPVVLVLLAGQPAPGLPFLRQLHWIVTPDPASENSLARLIDAAAGSGTRPGELWRYTAPYRGLAAMTEADSDFFFGRARETVEVLKVLEASPDCLPVLVGNSGVGKSSLAQAGVLAALTRQSWPENTGTADSWPPAFSNSRRWCVLKLQPGTEPIKALVEPFLRTWQLDSTDPLWAKRQVEWVEALNEGKLTLRDLLDATERRYDELHQDKPPTILLYVDQGEELYVRAEEGQRRRFSKVLAHALGDQRLRALMSIRADFLGALQNDEPLYNVHRQINVPPLREGELHEVISRPAALLSANFESDRLAPDIARRAAEESAKDAGALPLLSYLLDDMWTQMVKRGDGVLRLPAQAMELGGVLAERANAFLTAHPDEAGHLRRLLTLKLATVREDGEPTRRRAFRSECSAAEWRLVSELADHPHRLLVTAAPEGGETYAEVAHEAIFRRWEKLREWIAAERDFLVWRSSLEADRRSWESAPEPSRNDALLMGLALAQAQSWVVKRAEDVEKVDREFIDLSLKRDVLERQQRDVLRQRVLWTAIAALIIVTVLAVFSGFQWREAERQKLVAQQERDRAEQALANAPTSAFAYISRAFAYLGKGDTDRAIGDADEAIKLDPNIPQAFMIRGFAYASKGDYERALADYDKAIELDRNNSVVFNYRGLAYYNKKNYDRAIVDFDRAIMLDPNNSFVHEWYRNRGNVYYDKADYDRAIANYDQAINANPKYATAHNNRGNAYFNKGDYDRSILEYDAAIALEPRGSDTYIWYCNRGNVYRNKGQFDRALGDYEQSLGLNPKYADAYYNRGFAYYGKIDYEHAIADLNQAIELNSKHELAYYVRGNAYFLSKDYDRAIADYDATLQLNPKFAAALFGRGLAKLRKGDTAGANADIDSAKVINPGIAEEMARAGIR